MALVWLEKDLNFGGYGALLLRWNKNTEVRILEGNVLYGLYICIITVWHKHAIWSRRNACWKKNANLASVTEPAHLGWAVKSVKKQQNPMDNGFTVRVNKCHMHWAALSNFVCFSSIQFSSVQSLSRVQLCDPMNHSSPGLPVHHQLLEFTQTHAHRISDAIQPSHPLSSPSPPAPNPSQHQGLLQWVNSSHEVAKVLEFQLQRQSFQWKPRTDLL